MKLRDYPAILSRAFGKENIDLSMFVDPLQNHILDDTVFVDKDGKPVVATAAQGLNCVFLAPLAGPFYDLDFVGLTLGYSRPLTVRLPKWKPLRVLAENTSKGLRYHSAVFYVKASLDRLHDYGVENGIRWYDGDSSGTKEFEGLKRYVQWLKGKADQGSCTPSG